MFKPRTRVFKSGCNRAILFFGSTNRRSAPREFAGQILINPVGPHTAKRVPGGLIHDWAGAAFYPDAKLQDMSEVARDYAHYNDYFRPGVISAKAIGRPGEDRFSMMLADHSVFQHDAIESEFVSRSIRVDAHRRHSLTWSNADATDRLPLRCAGRSIRSSAAFRRVPR